jgi:hypothetical protein
MRTSFLISRVIVGLFYLCSAIDGLVQLDGKGESESSRGATLHQATIPASVILLLIAIIAILNGTEVRIGVAALVLLFVPASVITHAFRNRRESLRQLSASRMPLQTGPDGDEFGATGTSRALTAQARHVPGTRADGPMD